MRVAWNLLLVIAGSVLVVYGVRSATTRPRPHNLGGMVLSAVGLALVIGGLAAATRLWGR